MEKNNKDELLKAVADVLDEALQEYEKLAKMDNLELAEDPTRPMIKPDMSEEDKDGEEDEESEEDKDPEAKEGEDDKEEDEESDEDLENAYKSISAKMEKRGLKKSEAIVADLKKSEAAAEDLRKSVDDRFEALTKTIQGLAETVNKIASAPARKGVSGLQPLRKNEEGSDQPQALNKSETVNKLLNLKKSGNHVDTSLINRIETDRTTAADHASIKKLLG